MFLAILSYLVASFFTTSTKIDVFSVNFQVAPYFFTEILQLKINEARILVYSHQTLCRQAMNETFSLI